MLTADFSSTISVTRPTKGLFLNYLCHEGHITPDQKHILEREIQRTLSTPEKLVIQLGFINSQNLVHIMANYSECRVFDHRQHRIDNYITASFPQIEAKHHKILPITCDKASSLIFVIMVDMDDIMALDKVQGYFPLYTLVPLLISEGDFHSIVDYAYAEQSHSQQHQVPAVLTSSQPEVSDSPTVINSIHFIEDVLHDAIKMAASDIHFEPDAHFVRIRMRCDGLLKLYRTLHRDHWPVLCVRLKIISTLDIAESRLPQDGRFSFDLQGRNIDMRTAVHPTLYGENIVIRILDKRHSLKSMDELGFSTEQITNLQSLVQQPEGLIILTGPTGSGKTTTLYSLLQFIRTQDVNIMTLEEPVEYEIQGLRQTEIKDVTGMTYADGVRSILRQDPDIILIGEIRDAETAEMAIRAALTGHLVLTTLHAHDCFSTFHRLANLGVSPSLMAGNILGIISQRLLRKVCTECRSNSVTPHETHCFTCDSVGYKGRLAIAEILTINESLETLIETQQPLAQLRACAHHYGFQDLRVMANRLVELGLTTSAEVKRVLRNQR